MSNNYKILQIFTFIICIKGGLISVDLFFKNDLFYLINVNNITYRRRDPRSSGPVAGPRDPRASMTRPIGNQPPSVSVGNQPSAGSALTSAAPTSAAIGRALGAGTDQEKVPNQALSFLFRFSFLF